MRKYFKYWKWLFPPLYPIPNFWVENADTYYYKAVEWRLKVKDVVQTGVKTTLITAVVTAVILLIILNKKR